MAAVRLLVQSKGGLSTERLNTLTGSSAGGPIPGGLLAWATRNHLYPPLRCARREEGKQYVFASEYVRDLFARVLLGVGSPDAVLPAVPEESRRGMLADIKVIRERLASIEKALSPESGK